MSKPVAIIVEFEDGVKKRWEYPAIEVNEEVGYRRQDIFQTDLAGYESNGHRRLTIKAWDGCETYDSFEVKEGDNETNM